MKALLALVLLAGCTIENKGGSISLLQPQPPIVIETRAALVPDEPIFRILDIYGGRMRLLVQDPITRHFKVVGP
jgi:hypothetical protein